MKAPVFFIYFLGVLGCGSECIASPHTEKDL